MCGFICSWKFCCCVVSVWNVRVCLLMWCRFIILLLFVILLVNMFIVLRCGWRCCVSWVG